MTHHPRTNSTGTSFLIAATLGLIALPGVTVTRACAQSGSDYSSSMEERGALHGDAVSAFEQGYWAGRDFERRNAGMSQLRSRSMDTGSARSDRNDQELYRGSYGRGYRLGRDAENRQTTTASRSDQQMAAPDLAIVLVERDRQRQAMQQVREALQLARSALKRGDQAQAQQALSQADDTVQRAAQAAEGWHQIDQALDKADQSLEQNDRNGAERAIKDARQQLTALRTSQPSGSSSQANKAGSENVSSDTAASSSQSSDPADASKK